MAAARRGVGLDRGPGGGGLQVFVAGGPDGAELLGGLAQLDRLHCRLVGGEAAGEVGGDGGFGGP